MDVRLLDSITNWSSPENEWSVCVRAFGWKGKIEREKEKKKHTFNAANGKKPMELGKWMYDKRRKEEKKYIKRSKRKKGIKNPFYYVYFMSLTVCVRSIKIEMYTKEAEFWQQQKKRQKQERL